MIFLDRPTLPQDYVDQAWTKLKGAVEAVHKKQPVATSLEELYQVNYNKIKNEIFKWILSYEIFLWMNETFIVLGCGKPLFE